MFGLCDNIKTSIRLHSTSELSNVNKPVFHERNTEKRISGDIVVDSEGMRFIP